MPTYEFVDTQNNLQKVDATSPEEAMKLAPSIQKNSGVMLSAAQIPAPEKSSKKTKKSSITSSADPILDKQKDKSMSGSISALNSDPKNQMSEFDKEYFKRMDARESSIIAGEKDSLKVAKATYDTALEKLNYSNAELSAEIESRYDKTRQIAATNAAALNPYNQAKGAQTASNFQAKITDNFNEAITKLEQNTQMEKRALAAGNMTAVNAIKQDTRKTLADLDDKIFSYGLEMKKEAEANKRFEQTFGLQKEQLDVTKQARAQDDFQTYINTMSGSPGLQNDIASYFATGKVSPGLAPFIERGMAAGMSPTESLSVLQYQSDKVRQQEATENYRYQQMLNAQAGGTKAANYAAQMAQIQTRSQELIAQGIMPGSMEYAKGISGATAGSQTGMSSSEAGNYATIANIGNQLVGLKSSLDALKEDNDLKTMVLNKTGASVQSLTDKDLALLTARVNGIAAPVARVMFGERGVLTEPDIKRVMSTLPSGASSSEVRDALYREILINAKAGAINKLSIDASTGRNTTGVAPYVEQFVKEVDGILQTMPAGGSKGPTPGPTPSPSGFKTSAGKNYNF